TTAFREASFPVALYVQLLEALIPSAYARSPFLAISESTRDDLAKRGIPRSQVTVVHCGLDHGRYRVDPAVRKTPEPTVLYIGRLRRYKGVDWVMRSWPLVREKVAGARLLVVGDGPHRAALEKSAARDQLGDSVEFLGFMGS